ncbi:MAG: LexA family transcriptional regulator [Gammaproteobacteria bacterium]|nr:LexA family transcriptional regulator [Gammaproteobacteria bacterium]
MSKQTLSENLKYLIKLHNGVSILELAKRTQIPQPTLHHILNGETKKPRNHALEALANFFSISVDQLIGITPLPIIPNALKNSLKISTVPIIEWEMIKHWPQKNMHSHHYKEIILDKKVDRNSFAIIMKDSQMEPMFPEKSVLLFDPSKTPRDRDYAIVCLAKNNLIILNRLFIDGSIYYIKQDQEDGNAQLTKLKQDQDKVIAILFEVRLQF